MNINLAMAAEVTRVFADIEAGVRYIEVTVPLSERVDTYIARLRRQIVKQHPYISIRWQKGDIAAGKNHKLIIPNPRLI